MNMKIESILRKNETISDHLSQEVLSAQLENAFYDLHSENFKFHLEFDAGLELVITEALSVCQLLALNKTIWSPFDKTIEYKYKEK